MRILSATLSICMILASPTAAVRGQTAPASVGVPGVNEFTIRPGDILRIRVWPDSALGGDFPVEESGLVYLPLLGEVRAGGMSLEALRRQLRHGYAEGIKNPVVTVTPVFRVSVLGAVARPGLYQVDPTQSLFDVISLAGGFRPEAKEKRLRVIRDGQVLQINAKRALETGEALLGLALRSGDRIVVPERRRSVLTIQNLGFFLQSAVLVVTIIQLARS